MKVIDAHVVKVPMMDPGDISGIEAAIDSGEIDPKDVVAVIGKTEGNGLVNDFSRGEASLACGLLFSRHLNIPLDEARKTISLVMSGGTEGVLSPHFTIFSRKTLDVKIDVEGKRLSIGVKNTRDFKPEEIGTMAMVSEVSQRVKEAINDAQIEDPRDVHFVQIKCPLLTSAKIKDAQDRGEKTVTTDTLKSMGYSRGASALGVAVALGEVDKADLIDEEIYANRTLFSNVASTSAGVELENCEIVVLGNSSHSISKLRIGHSVMKDIIDAEAVMDALRNAGLTVECRPTEEQAKRIVNIFAKCDASTSGEVRGRRHTMLTDSMLPGTRHSRAVVGAIIASITGDPMIYVSGGSEHQGPPGGGPVAAIITVY